MLDIFKGYFEEDFDEDSIRDNFTLVYELLDGAFFSTLSHLFFPPRLSARLPLAAFPPPPAAQRSSTTATRRTRRWTC
jgi:hypothetical protein